MGNPLGDEFPQRVQIHAFTIDAVGDVFLIKDFHQLLVHGQVQFLKQVAQHGAARMPADQHGPLTAKPRRLDVLVGDRCAKHPGLVETGLGGECVDAEDSLVPRRGKTDRLAKNLKGVVKTTGPGGRGHTELRAFVRKHRNQLLQRSVAGTLTDTRQCHLHLVGTGLDAGQRIRQRQAKILMAVRAHRDLRRDPRPDPADQAAELDRGHATGGISKHHNVRARRHRLHDQRPQQTIRTTRRILDTQRDVLHAQRLRVGDRVDHLPLCLRLTDPAFVLQMCLAAGRQDLHVVTLRATGLHGQVDVLALCSAEGRDPGGGNRLGDQPGCLVVTRRRAGKTGLDHVDTDCLDSQRNIEFLLRPHRVARRLLTIAQGTIENRDSSQRRITHAVPPIKPSSEAVTRRA